MAKTKLSTPIPARFTCQRDQFCKLHVSMPELKSFCRVVRFCHPSGGHYQPLQNFDESEKSRGTKLLRWNSQLKVKKTQRRISPAARLSNFISSNRYQTRSSPTPALSPRGGMVTTANASEPTRSATESFQQSSMPSKLAISGICKTPEASFSKISTEMTPSSDEEIFDSEGALIENPSRDPDDSLYDEVSSSYAPKQAYCFPLDHSALASAPAADTTGVPEEKFIPSCQISDSLTFQYGKNTDLEAWFLAVGPPPSLESLYKVHNASYMLFGIPPSELPLDLCRALIQNVDLLPKAVEA